MEFYLSWSKMVKRDILQVVNDQICLFDMKVCWCMDVVEWDIFVLDLLNYLQYYKDIEWMVCLFVIVGLFFVVVYYFGKMLQDSLKVFVGLICNVIGGLFIEVWVDCSILEYKFFVILCNWI